MPKATMTRQAILDQSVELAATVGLSGLTIGSLASRTGMSKSGLYAHFRSKQALQLDVLDHARASFVHLVVAPAIAAPRGETRLRELFRRWSESDRLPGGCLFVKAATEYDDQHGPVRDQLARDHRDLLDSIVAMCGGAVTENQFRSDLDTEQFAHDFYGIMLIYYLSHRLLDEPAAHTRAEDAFERLLGAARG